MKDGETAMNATQSNLPIAGPLLGMALAIVALIVLVLN